MHQSFLKRDKNPPASGSGFSSRKSKVENWLLLPAHSFQVLRLSDKLLLLSLELDLLNLLFSPSLK